MKNLSCVDVVSPNWHESLTLFGLNESQATPEAVCVQYRSGGAKTVVLRMSERGAMILPEKAADGKPIYVPVALPATGVVVDTVGAGNAFCGGYLAGSADPIKAAVQGAVAASFAVCFRFSHSHRRVGCVFARMILFTAHTVMMVTDRAIWYSGIKCSVTDFSRSTICSTLQSSIS